MLRQHEPVPPYTVLFDGTLNGQWAREVIREHHLSPPSPAAPISRKPDDGLVLLVLQETQAALSRRALEARTGLSRWAIEYETHRLERAGKVIKSREPFGRRLHLFKAFNGSTLSSGKKEQ